MGPVHGEETSRAGRVLSRGRTGSESCCEGQKGEK